MTVVTLRNCDYYKARMYSPLGRFMQPDPIGTAGGVNLYAYVENDPVNLTDPLGLDGCGGDCSAIFVTGAATILSGGFSTFLIPGLQAHDSEDITQIVVHGRRLHRPTGNAPFYYNGTAYVPDPLYNPKCGASALGRHVVPFLADAAGLVPGTSTARILTRLGGATVSGAISAWRGEKAGVGLSYAGIQADLFGPAGAGTGIRGAKLLPYAGQIAASTAVGLDIINTTREFLNCGSAQ